MKFNFTDTSQMSFLEIKWQGRQALLLNVAQLQKTNHQTMAALLNESMALMAKQCPILESIIVCYQCGVIHGKSWCSS